MRQAASFLCNYHQSSMWHCYSPLVPREVGWEVLRGGRKRTRSARNTAPTASLRRYAPGLPLKHCPWFVQSEYIPSPPHRQIQSRSPGSRAVSSDDPIHPTSHCPSCQEHYQKCCCMLPERRQGHGAVESRSECASRARVGA